MAEIKLDMGLREYQVGCGVLRFNPTDPNLYHRFLETADQMEKLEQEMSRQAQQAADAQKGLALLADADRQAKELLNQCFGAGNDFEAVLGGVSLLAVCKNGQRAVTNLLTALQPVLEEGARAFYENAAAPELQRAEARRAGGRA